jgi:hypothetical protein
MNTSDLSIEATNAASVAEHEGVKVLKVSSAKIPHLAQEMLRKGFKRVALHTWIRPLDYVLDNNAYDEN